jgi:hypothetical protein
VVSVAIIAITAIIFHILTKRAALQIRHKFLTPPKGIAKIKYKPEAIQNEKLKQ